MTKEEAIAKGKFTAPIKKKGKDIPKYQRWLDSGYVTKSPSMIKDMVTAMINIQENNLTGTGYGKGGVLPGQSVMSYVKVIVEKIQSIEHIVEYNNTRKGYHRITPLAEAKIPNVIKTSKV